jgi:hypothetical protein
MKVNGQLREPAALLSATSVALGYGGWAPEPVWTLWLNKGKVVRVLN